MRPDTLWWPITWVCVCEVSPLFRIVSGVHRGAPITAAPITDAVRLACAMNSSDKAMQAHLRWLEIRTSDVVELRWTIIDALARALVAHLRMSGSEVEHRIHAEVMKRPTAIGV